MKTELVALHPQSNPHVVILLRRVFHYTDKFVVNTHAGCRTGVFIRYNWFQYSNLNDIKKGITYVIPFFILER